ncbi:hypothetical protein [Curtobacterium aurantiacum]|uniref:hypothetical protein n=1 Tax=Curtobacterium aurantiacum TaxID=3236919 RepID=UPI001BDFDAD4|nr:hypothetical protein [Curtobacterium flaccumfaciens]MBT1675999.1 hypothetical protein [Curtobacterium flaccumfaciens pv. flaccumfaciens]
MTLTRTTRADASAYALGLAGRTRDRLPVPWTASPVMDDCAAFCSHVLWGGKPGPILWVDNFKTAGDGTYAAGTDDLEPWDVLIFDWEGNGVGNHVEFMVGDLGNGYVTTYGANGADSREARYRTRPLRYVQGRFRPRWTSAPIPAPSKPANSHTAPRRHRMYSIIPVTKKPTEKANAAYVCGPSGKRVPIQSPEDRDLLVRYRDNDGSDTMLTRELDIVASYLERIA